MGKAGEKIKYLFGSIDMSWKKVIIFALAAGAYTGAINQIPVLQNTSFTDIAVSYEAWVLFGILIAVNCRKPLEAGFKVLVFFLISQVLCFAVEIPSIGFSQAYYYLQTWFVKILLTFPGGIIAFFAKKNNVAGALITSAAASITAVSLVNYGASVVFDFPRHLLTVLFCIITIICFIKFIVQRKSMRTIVIVITVIVGLAFGYQMVNSQTLTSGFIPAGYDHYTLEVNDGSYVKINSETDTFNYYYKPFLLRNDRITFTNGRNEKIIFRVEKEKNTVKLVKMK